MTPTQTLCNAAGLDVKTAAKKARLHPRTLARKINEGCSDGLAADLTRILKCDPLVFVWGYNHWEKYFSHNGKAVTGETVDPLPVSLRDRRRHILKLL